MYLYIKPCFTLLIILSFVRLTAYCSPPDYIHEQLINKLKKEEPDSIRIKQLLKEGANVNYEDMVQNTALHWVAINGHTKFVALLLNAGADPSVKDRGGDKAVDRTTDTTIKNLFK